MYENRYKDELIFDRIDSKGNVRETQTIFILDRKYNKDEISIHIVKNKENLFMIADNYYDDFRLWWKIAEKNPLITNPFELVEGSELIIPFDE